MALDDLLDCAAAMVSTRWQLEMNTDTKGIKKNRQEIEVTRCPSIHTVAGRVWTRNDTHIHSDDRGVDSISVCFAGVTLPSLCRTSSALQSRSVLVLAPCTAAC